ncbi:MAG: hypothetical protein EZS28_009660 [Streblomastix strix]|uniref:Uncharacterized protein n=1 Tax=Streblomastix strix TaxID=222440 RepID=A0A5J4WIK6_9EUKA|nr:MAG: hypothetical protein EZS28_009660 [Streblomastix strix]
MDTWNVNGKSQFEAQSYVYETVKKQTDLIETGVQGLNRTKYLNNEIKLVDELAIYKANREAYFVKDGPFIIYSFGAKLAQLGANFEEFSAMCLFKDTYDKSFAVQVAISGQLNMFDCEIEGTYILDNYASSANTNESAREDVESHINEVIIKHEKQLSSSPQPQYTITNMFNQFVIMNFFPSSAYNAFYIVDDGTCRVCIFNLHFESKGLNGRTQEVGRISDSILPADGKRCTADLIKGLHAEPLIDSGLKNLICRIKPLTISTKNYDITDVTANMAGYKATDACLNRVRQFYSQRLFVVPAQRVEVWLFPTSATLTAIRTSQNIALSHETDFCRLFPKDARATTCFENPCYQNMQITTCGNNFPDMPMNTLDQQFFQL